MQKKRVLLRDKYFVPYRNREVLKQDVQSVAEKLNRDLPNMERPIALGVLNGAYVFAADLLRELRYDLNIEFVRYASYAGTSTTGNVRQLMGLTQDIKERDVLVVEDIVDSGLTMRSMIDYLLGQGAKSVKVVTMFYKPEAFQGGFEVDYVAHALPNLFVVGYGLDYDGMGRALPDLFILDEE